MLIKLIHVISYALVFMSCFSVEASAINFVFFQTSMFRVLYILLVLVSAIEFLSRYRIKVKNSYSIKFMVIWLVYSIISGVWAWTYSFSGWIQAVYFVSVYTVIAVIFSTYIKKETAIKRIFCCIQLGISVQAFIGLYEHFTGNYLWISEELLELVSQNPYLLKMRYPLAMQGNPNDFALLMFLEIFVSLACFRLYKNKIMKMFSLALIVDCLYLIYVSDSRMVLAGSFVGIIFTIFNTKSIDKKFKRILYSIFGLIILTILYKDWLSTALDKVHIDFSAGSESTRLEIIQIGIRSLFSSFGFGLGVYRIPGMPAWHNWWVEIFVDFGVLVFAGYIIFYIKLFKNIKKYNNQAPRKLTYNLTTSILAIIIGFACASISPASCLRLEWLGVFWAAVIAYEKILINERANMPPADSF